MAQVIADAFYEEVTFERISHELGTYFLTKVPKYDKNGQFIKLKYGGANDQPKGYLESPREFAKRKGATLVTNCSTYSDVTNRQVGTTIYDSVVIDELTKQPYNWILGIKPDNTLKAFPHTTSAATILAEGYTNALTGFIPLIQGGALVADSVFESRDIFIEPNPRQAIAQDASGNIYFFTSEGRRFNEKGMLAKDVANILLGHGMVFAYMLDGGGSAQTVYNGMLLNRVTDDFGRVERETVGFLYVGKDLPVEETGAEMLNAVGDVVQVLQDQMAEYEDKFERSIGDADTQLLFSDPELPWYTSVGSDYGTSGAGLPRAWVDASDGLYFLGVVKVSALGSANPFLQIPEQYRPRITQEFLTCGYNTNNNLYKIRVNSSGAVYATLLSGSTSTHSINLNGIVVPLG